MTDANHIIRTINQAEEVHDRSGRTGRMSLQLKAAPAVLQTL